MGWSLTGWRPTAALHRALAVSGCGLVLALLFGEPVLVVLVAPLLVHAALALRHRPRGELPVRPVLGHPVLHEGQGTRSVLVVPDEALSAAEQVTRVVARTPYVALHPAHGRVATVLRPGEDLPTIEASPRRWGRLELGEERVAFTSRWAGYRWGPELFAGPPVTALPTGAPFDARAGMPRPVGLVGAHRSPRTGTGTELSGIRPFVPGDRLRRVHWPVSLRTRELHVVSTQAEQDAGVVLVVDALADVGRSGGTEGPASSLDVTVRAGAALAEHYLRAGDRVSLRVIGGDGGSVPLGSGGRHLQLVLGALSRIRPGLGDHLPEEGLSLRVSAGTVVLILSPVLSPVIAGTAVQLTRRGLPALVVDTLPPSLVAGGDPGEVGRELDVADPALTSLAWRMRLLERAGLRERLAATGCPIVVWRGPGTLDEVLHRLARRAQVPRVRVW